MTTGTILFSFGRAVARAESERLRALLNVARAQNIFGERE